MSRDWVEEKLGVSFQAEGRRVKGSLARTALIDANHRKKIEDTGAGRSFQVPPGDRNLRKV